MKLKHLGYITGIIAVIWSWNAISKGLKDWGISEKLGNNYILTSDKEILYQLDNHEYFVIPAEVSSVNYNEKWIIAKTQGMNASFKGSNQQCDDGSQYWIINKDASILNLDSMYKSKSAKMLIKDYSDPYNIISTGIIGPFDSISFYKKINDLKINLAFD